MAERRIYKVIFSSQGKIYEIYAKSVAQGSIFGFVEVEQVLFGERTQVVVDPSEEQLKNEFRDVRRSYIPMHAIVRIDEVEKQGVSRITGGAAGQGTVAPFPGPVLPRPPGGSETT